MQQWEYRNNQKILGRFKVELEASVGEDEEVDCLVTKSHLVIETKQPIEIPIPYIKGCDIYSPRPSLSYSSPTQVQVPLSDEATLTFLDDLNKKHRLRFKVIGGDGFSLKLLIERQIDEQKLLNTWAGITERSQLYHANTTSGGFWHAARERFRDKFRDRVCAGLRKLGIDAQMSLRGRIEEMVCGGESLGIIDIDNSPITWINTRREKGDGGQSSHVYYFIDYGILDNRLGQNSNLLEIRTIRVKTIPWFGRVVDLRWEGEDLNLGIISRLNSDISLKPPIMRSYDVMIHADGQHGYWIISAETIEVPSPELWSCYEAIAQHLLTEWSSV